MSKGRNKSYIANYIEREKDTLFTKDGYANLLSYLGRVKQGNDKDYRTPFFDKASREKILDGWSHILDKLKDEWPTLLDFENHLREKVGPMSIMKPWDERREDLFSYFSDVDVHMSDFDYRAIDAAIAEFGPLRGMRPRSESNTVLKMKKSTNSGNPYFTKRKLVLRDTLPVKLSHENAIPGDTWQVISPTKQEWRSAAVVGWRGQEGGPEDADVKQRVIWMFPFGINVCELRVYQPLIEGCQSKNIVPAWVSFDAVDARMTKLFDTKDSHDLIVCTDFTKFDQHFNRKMQDVAKQILSSILIHTQDTENWLENVFPVKYNIPIVTPDGVYRYPHGMGSGSGGTNADETLAHRALQYEAAIVNGKRLNTNSMCLGDDGVLSFPGITIDKVTSVYCSHGLEMNVTKQYADTETAEYLRRWYNTRYRIDGICRGVYSTYRALGRLAGQERFYDPEFWTPEMVNLRYLSIIENVKWHPLREEFVQYCMKGDKFRLGLDLPGFFDNLNKHAKEATDYMPDFLGYTKSLQNTTNPSEGINDWWIVKYLKSLK